MWQIDKNKIWLQALQANWLSDRGLQLDVLRLDGVHPVISGNKWFKLHYYITDAVAKGFNHIATFGGAYSNHIVAAASACRHLDLKCTGVVRGDEPALQQSHTLLQAQELGMELKFVSRDAYHHKDEIKKEFTDTYWIEEGGYGTFGAAGAALLMHHVPDREQYTHLVCAVGTGTTLAGLVESAAPHQTAIGVCVLKGYQQAKEDVKKVLPPHLHNRVFYVAHGFHFGGYARHTPTLIDYMNDTWREHGLPTDFVYTAKALYGIEAMVYQQLIETGSRVLMVHTGGLQGNLSLPQGLLAF